MPKFKHPTAFRYDPKNSESGGVIGDFFETIKNSHQIDFISLICSALHNFSLGLFP